jgi:hypothetical protein
VQGPSTNIVLVRVTDDGVPTLSMTNQFTVIVREANAAPTFVGLTNATVPELVLYTQTLSGSDSDVPVQALSFSLVVGPAGSGVTNGVFAWTPTEIQGPSTNEVQVSVTDGVIVTINAFTVVVTEVNAAPVFVGLTNAVVPESVGYTQNISASDGDLPAQPLTLALVSGPVGSVLTNGVFAWTPTEAHGTSTNEVRVSVADGLAVTTNSFSVIVLDSTSPPVPEFGGLPVVESGKLRFAILGAGRVRVEMSSDLVRWASVETLTLESGVVRIWEQAVGMEPFRAYRLVLE